MSNERVNLEVKLRVLDGSSSPTLQPSSGGIDPRIRQRRIEVRRHEGRRRLIVLLVVLGLALGSVSSWVTLRTALFDVDRILVTGATRTGEVHVVRAAGLRRGQAMIDIDTERAAVGAARLPWIARATVTRRWPGTVTVRVEERSPAAVLVTDDGKELLVDPVGRLLGSRGGRSDAGLPVLRGIAPKGPAGSRLGPEASDALVFAEGLASRLRGPLRARVDHIRPDPDGGVRLALRPAGQVLLGPPSLVEEKLSALAAVLAGADMSNVAVIDLRVPSAPVLTRGAPVAKVSTRSTA